MAEKEIYPKGIVKQTEEFSKASDMKQDVFDLIKDILKTTTEDAFEKAGFGHVEKYAGEYADGEKFGVGVEKDKYNIKIAGKTKTILEKQINFGTKRMLSDIKIDYDATNNILNFTYNTTEGGAFRGYESAIGPFMVTDKIVIHVTTIDKLKKELKEKLSDIAKKEVAYLTSTKLGVEDKTDKSTNASMVENMNKLSMKDMMSDSFDDIISKVNSFLGEGKKSKEDEGDDDKKDKDDNLLLGDEIEKKAKTVDERTKELEEITASGGNAAGGAYLTPAAWKSGGDLNIGKEKKKFEDTAYAKGQQKRASVKKSIKEDGFWTAVELNPGSGYVPKGMEKNWPIGLHGVEVNSSAEDKISRKGTAGRSLKEEKEFLIKKKFISLNENEEKGINKRYIITEQRDGAEEKDRWKKLIDLKPYETIKNAEDPTALNECGCGEEVTSDATMISRGEANTEAEAEFEKRNSDVQAGESIDGKEVVVVPKSDSLTNVIYKMFKEDYENPKKMYVVDMITGNYVINPAYNKKK